jgi:hypothetical protein
MKCSYDSNGMINCLETFSTNNITNFDTSGYKRFSDTANLTGIIFDNNFYKNSNKNIQIRAYIDNEIRSRKMRPKDIKKVPGNSIIKKELHNKNIFYLTIYGNPEDTNKSIHFKLMVDNKLYDLKSNKNLIFLKNNRFKSNLLKPIRFIIEENNLGIDKKNTLPVKNVYKKLVGDDRKIVKDDKKLVGDDRKIIKDDKKLVGDDRKIIKDDKKLVGDDRRILKEDKKLVSTDSKLSDKQDKPISIERNKVGIDSNLKMCLNNFLDCNNDSEELKRNCLNKFLKCNKDDSFEKCTKHFVKCNKK